MFLDNDKYFKKFRLSKNVLLHTSEYICLAYMLPSLHTPWKKNKILRKSASKM